MDNILNIVRNNPLIISCVILVLFVIVVVLGIKAFSKSSKSSFDNVLNNMNLTTIPPQAFPSLDAQDSGGINLSNPEVPEEIGLAMKYPQGDGVSMSPSDSNSFYPNKPGPLLTSYQGPESYGESSLTNPLGDTGADQGARVLKIKSTGNQLKYKAIDESLNKSYASAYSDGGVQNGNTLINNAKPVNYDDNFNPENNMMIQTSPGQESTLTNCESTYPNVVKYKDFCITAGDIPYGQIVDNKVNPRLVSRWESFTGDYSREDALEPIDGVLYPNLNVLKVQ